MRDIGLTVLPPHNEYEREVRELTGRLHHGRGQTTCLVRAKHEPINRSKSCLMIGSPAGDNNVILRFTAVKAGMVLVVTDKENLTLGKDVVAVEEEKRGIRRRENGRGHCAAKQSGDSGIPATYSRRR